MKYGHRVQGKIIGYDDKGRGVFKLDRGNQNYDQGKGIAAVPFSAVGDEIAGTFIKRDQGVKIVKLSEVITPGPDRVKALCPHAGICGGCLWQHLKYEAQLELKRDMINRAFEKAGHRERIATVLGCKGPAIRDEMRQSPFYYRNRMDYAIGWLGTVGLKEYGSWNRYLDLSTCLLLDEDTPQIIAAVRELMRDLDLEPWDAREHTGLMRYLVIRLGRNTGERMVMLAVSDLTRVTEETRQAILKRLGPLSTSLLLGEQPLPTDLSYVKTAVALKGNPWLEEEVNGVRYRLAPNSFFQTNTAMAGELQKTVAEMFCHPRVGGDPSLPDSRLHGNDNVLDLYCGLGFFGIYLAKTNPTLKVHGYEIDAEAIELAKHNAAVNGVEARCTFTAGPSEDLNWKDTNADTVILDPPRAGLHPRVLKTLLEKKPRNLIYVSCNYHRLVEELKELKTAYRIEEVRALDLFPHTPHVEVVTRLSLV